MTESQALNFSTSCLRLRSDGSSERFAMDGVFWQRLMTGQLGDFHHEFLVTSIGYDKNWSNWEMHPNGDEIVCLLSGSVTFMLEEAHGTIAVSLRDSGAFVVVPKGIWHTADIHGQCRMLFITPGEGTRHRQRVETSPQQTGFICLAD